MVAMTKDVAMDIVDIKFLKTIQTATGSWTVNSQFTNTYRYAIITVKVNKPSGSPLSVAACDLSLHYTLDVPFKTSYISPCIGLSAFNKSEDEDRVLTLGDAKNVNTPAFLTITTGAHAKDAHTVYFDVLFANIETNINNVWLYVGQPAKKTPFATKGWMP